MSTLRFYSTNQMYDDFCVETFNIFLNECQTLLYALCEIKINIKDYRPAHYYDKKLKNNNNLKVSFNDEDLGKSKPID